MNDPQPRPSLPPEIVRQLVEAVASLEFGRVVITVHQGKVQEIERAEKVRPHEYR